MPIRKVAIVTLSRSTEKKGEAGGEAIPWRRQQLARDCWLALFCSSSLSVPTPRGSQSPQTPRQGWSPAQLLFWRSLPPGPAALRGPRQRVPSQRCGRAGDQKSPCSCSPRVAFGRSPSLHLGLADFHSGAQQQRTCMPLGTLVHLCDFWQHRAPVLLSLLMLTSLLVCVHHPSFWPRPGTLSGVQLPRAHPCCFNPPHPSASRTASCRTVLAVGKEKARHELVFVCCREKKKHLRTAVTHNLLAKIRLKPSLEMPCLSSGISESCSPRL